MVDNADKAIQIACNKTGARVFEYTAAPVFMGSNAKGSHQWVIEFEKEPENLKLFSNELDSALKSLNSDYEAKRYKNFALEMPIVHNIKKGTFYLWFQKKGKLGGQNKMPRLSNQRNYIEELMLIEKEL
jgi:hypothetical protein